MTLTQLFTNIANAIRGKKGTSELIKAEDFADEITNLPSGGNVVVPDGMKFGFTKALPENFSSWDFSNLKNGEDLFRSCQLTNCPDFENSQITTFKNMFASSFALTTVGNFSNKSSMGNFINVFYSCANLKTIGEIQLFPYGGNIRLTNCFLGCKKLTDFTFVCNWEDNINVTLTAQDLFGYCSELSNHALDNILYLCSKIANTSTSNKTLAYLGVKDIYDEIIPTLPHYQEFLDAGWIIR